MPVPDADVRRSTHAVHRKFSFLARFGEAEQRCDAGVEKTCWKRSRSMTGPMDDDEKPAMPHVRTAHDAGDDERLNANPADEDAKLDVALDETFPTSDPPSNTQPGKGKDPAPSSGYDEDEEKRREARR
jgi:hypothetical protein